MTGDELVRIGNAADEHAAMVAVDGDGSSLADALDALRVANGGTLLTVTTGCDSEPADEQLDLFGEAS